MQLGIDSFVATFADPRTQITVSPVQRMADTLDEIELADRDDRRAGDKMRRPGERRSHEEDDEAAGNLEAGPNPAEVEEKREDERRQPDNGKRIGAEEEVEGQEGERDPGEGR